MRSWFEIKVRAVLGPGEKDDKEERDDEEARERALRMDEYKDDHRRGEGNRHNMG